MKLVFTVLTIMTSVSAHAALSGYYDSAKKIDAAMLNSDVANAFGQQKINKIEVDGLNVKIETVSCVAVVTLKAIQQRGPGPVSYEVNGLTAPQCN